MTIPVIGPKDLIYYFFNIKPKESPNSFYYKRYHYVSSQRFDLTTGEITFWFLDLLQEIFPWKGPEPVYQNYDRWHIMNISAILERYFSRDSN